MKRWLALGVLGLAAVAIGIVFVLQLSVGPRFQSFMGTLSLQAAPSAIRGGVFIGLGVFVVGGASLGLLNSLAGAWSRRGHWALLDLLYIERVLGAGPKIVALGGGNGLPSLLRGLKHYTSNISAVVTVADDGGSSGRLRSELGIQPPGDIRNCLVALADSEAVMQQLMDYRFSTNGQLDGHSFGNILIAALARIGGDFYSGVEAAGDLLAIRGKVIPSTHSDIILIASTVSGQRLIGESRVGNAPDRLKSIAIVPPNAPGHPDAVHAIEEADLILLAPGSLFT
ncbi:MAG: YvcK family protein, partial [Dehalococcoidia bacterium]|nr:YvcK family protein [Dehalococcoidia bacterium]